jgi:hypothetical protein
MNHLTWVLWKPEKGLRGSCDETLVPRVPSACCRGQQYAVVLALSPSLDATIGGYITLDLIHCYVTIYKVTYNQTQIRITRTHTNIFLRPSLSLWCTK